MDGGLDFLGGAGGEGLLAVGIALILSLLRRFLGSFYGLLRTNFVFMTPDQQPNGIMPNLYTPEGQQAITDAIGDARVIIVDMHAEATSEKNAMGWHLNGRASVVFGTHTHVQTSDDRILPGGTAYITDVGMCGPLDSVIGMDKETVIKGFLSQLPRQFEVAHENVVLQGIIVDVDHDSGQAREITRLRIPWQANQ